MENATDTEIWNYAKKKGFNIVTFDADFYDLATLKGHPRKVVWLRIGNTSTANLNKIIQQKEKIIKDFITSDTYAKIGCLEIK